MTSLLKIMKNTFIKVVPKFHSSIMLQRKDIVYLLSKLAKQWKLRSNDHLTSNKNRTHGNYQGWFQKILVGGSGRDYRHWDAVFACAK